MRTELGLCRRDPRESASLRPARAPATLPPGCGRAGRRPSLRRRGTQLPAAGPSGAVSAEGPDHPARRLLRLSPSRPRCPCGRELGGGRWGPGARDTQARPRRGLWRPTGRRAGGSGLPGPAAGRVPRVSLLSPNSGPQGRPHAAESGRPPGGQGRFRELGQAWASVKGNKGGTPCKENKKS